MALACVKKAWVVPFYASVCVGDALEVGCNGGQAEQAMRATGSEESRREERSEKTWTFFFCRELRELHSRPRRRGRLTAQQKSILSPSSFLSSSSFPASFPSNSGFWLLVFSFGSNKGRKENINFSPFFRFSQTRVLMFSLLSRPPLPRSSPPLLLQLKSPARSNSPRGSPRPRSPPPAAPRLHTARPRERFRSSSQSRLLLLSFPSKQRPGPRESRDI